MNLIDVNVQTIRRFKGTKSHSSMSLVNDWVNFKSSKHYILPTSEIQNQKLHKTPKTNTAKVPEIHIQAASHIYGYYTY